MGVPQVGRFIRENPNLKWMMTGGTPMTSETSNSSQSAFDDNLQCVDMRPVIVEEMWWNVPISAEYPEPG